MVAPAIETVQLTKVFPGRVTAVEGLDLRIRTGSVYGLIGPNGAGKTTALRLLMGLLRPQSGIAQILGYDLWNAPREVRARVAYISQTHQLPSGMTLAELSRYSSRLYERWDTGYGRALAEQWHLPFDRPIGQLSGGDQRKAALLLAFASRAEVLLLDEPAAGLDPIARRALVDEIIDLISRGDGATVLFSTHLLEDLERVVDTVGIMDQGRMILSTRLDDLLNTVKRIQVVFDGDSVPPGFEVPGAFQVETAGPVMTVLARIVNEAQLDDVRHWPAARLQVFPMDLEEILLSYFRRTPSRSSGSADRASASSKDRSSTFCNFHS